MRKPETQTDNVAKLSQSAGSNFFASGLRLKVDQLMNTLWAGGVNNPMDSIEQLPYLYKFCSDYPGIRHAGTAINAKRALCCRDSSLASMLLLSFSGYLSPQLDERVVLGV